MFIGEAGETSFTFTYDLDKTYTNNRNGTVENTTVSQPHDNVLVYTSKVPSNNYWIETTANFTQDGIVATLRNLNTNITTTKYYKRT